jgi:hypothetical protein
MQDPNPLLDNTQASPSMSQASDPNPLLDSSVATATNMANDPTSSKYNGFCQQFVDDIIGTPAQNRQPSASSAWSNYAQTGKAVQGTQGIKPGDIIYFNDPNDPNGHVGFYTGGDSFISATQQDPQHPVKTQSLKGWQDLTGDSVLGFVPRGGQQ